MLIGAFNQEKALLGAFSVIVKTDGSFAALIITDLVRVEVCQGFVGGLVPVLVVKHVVSLQAKVQI